MKTILIKKLLIAPMLLIGISRSYSQGFINLGFESANIPNLNPPDQSMYLSISNALPGWSGLLGTNPATQVLYNDLSAGSVEIALIGPNTDFFSNSVIAGKYTVVLQSGVANTTTVSASIAQTGLIPLNSLSVQFAVIEDHDALQLSFNGQNLPIMPLFAGNGYEEYGADISAFSGQVGQLQFTAEPTAFTPFENVYLDAIVFSTSPVPEPATFGLLVLGGAVFFGWRRRRLAR